jgi:Recombinase.
VFVLVPPQGTPFGYRKREDDPKRIEPDLESAEVVRHIFELCVGGKGPSQIARQLEKERIVNPSNYYFRKNGAALTNLDTTHPHHWKDTTVAKCWVTRSTSGTPRT